MQQPVGAGVQEQPELVGLPARARRLVGAREALHVLDQVLGCPIGPEGGAGRASSSRVSRRRPWPSRVQLCDPVRHT
jgi:hypothetical protein